MRRIISGIIILLTIVLAGCGGGGGSRTPTNPPTEEGIQVTVSPREITLAPQDSYLFTKGVTGATNPAVRWSVVEEIDGGLVSPDGKYTAPSTEGTCHVKVTSVQDPSKSDTATVTVRGVQVTISPREKTLVFQGSYQFTASVTGATNPAVRWSVVEEIDGGLVTPDGKYTAPSTEGVWHVKVTSVQDPSKSATATVVVVAELPPIPIPIPSTP